MEGELGHVTHSHIKIQPIEGDVSKRIKTKPVFFTKIPSGILYVWLITC